MISYNINHMDPETLMYFFEARMKRLLKDPKNFEHFTDEQMDMIENTILPFMHDILHFISSIPPLPPLPQPHDCSAPQA